MQPAPPTAIDPDSAAIPYPHILNSAKAVVEGGTRIVGTIAEPNTFSARAGNNRHISDGNALFPQYFQRRDPGISQKCGRADTCSLNSDTSNTIRMPPCSHRNRNAREIGRA